MSFSVKFDDMFVERYTSVKRFGTSDSGYEYKITRHLGKVRLPGFEQLLSDDRIMTFRSFLKYRCRKKIVGSVPDEVLIRIFPGEYASYKLWHRSYKRIIKDKYTVLSQTSESPEKNLSRLKESISRTRRLIFEKACCNDWQHFITITISPEKGIDKFDRSEVVKSFCKWIKDRNRTDLKGKPPIKYLIIPEPHKSGEWHLHGLFMNIPSDELVINEYGYLDWLPVRKAFGFVSFGSKPDYSINFSAGTIKNLQATARYVTKYITKDLFNISNNLDSGVKSYYCSKGLNKSSELTKGQLIPYDADSFFECLADYCTEENINYSDWSNDYVEIFNTVSEYIADYVNGCILPVSELVALVLKKFYKLRSLRKDLFDDMRLLRKGVPLEFKKEAYPPCKQLRLDFSG